MMLYDYVLFGDEWLVVTEIGGNWVRAFNGREYRRVAPEDLRPLPLSDAVLQGMGFKWQEMHAVRVYTQRDLFVEFRPIKMAQNEFICYTVEVYNGNGRLLLTDTVSFAHELQHIANRLGIVISCDCEEARQVLRKEEV